MIPQRASRRSTWMPWHTPAVLGAAPLDASPRHGQKGWCQCKRGRRKATMLVRSFLEVRQSTVGNRIPAIQREPCLDSLFLRLHWPCTLRPHPL